MTPKVQGATITSCAHQSSCFAPANSSTAVHLQVDQSSILISLDGRTKFVLNSVCLDVDQFGTDDQIKLLIRFVDGGAVRWTCLCNYLGKNRGGKSLLSYNPLGFEILGSCAFELRAEGTVKAASVDIACNVLPTADCVESVCMGDNIAQLPLKHTPSNKEASLIRSAVMSAIRYLPIRTILVSLVLLNLIQRGGGGFTKSFPSLHPTHRKTSESHIKGEKVTSEARLSPRAGSTSTNTSPAVSRKLNAVSVPIRNKQSSRREQMTSTTAPIESAAVNPPTATSTAPQDSLFSAVTNSPNSGQLEDECIDLTITLLPSSTSEEYPILWSLNTTEGAVWSKEYLDQDNMSSTMLVIEHASDEGICLLPGTYSFSFYGFQSHFMVSSGEEVISCGEVFKEEFVDDFDLPFQRSSSVEPGECSVILECSGADTNACIERAMKPLLCYNKGVYEMRLYILAFLGIAYESFFANRSGS